jgi:hypothetical protein
MFTSATGVPAAGGKGRFNRMICVTFAPQQTGFRSALHPAENMAPNNFNQFKCIELFGPADGTGAFTFSLEGAAIPDTDATFIRLEITGTFLGGSNPRTVTYTRASRLTYNGVGNSVWTWNIGSNDALVDGEIYNLRFVY